MSVYAQSGVNLQEGDAFSHLAGKICEESYGNSLFVEVCDFSSGHFRGPKGLRFVNLPDGYIVDAASDGIGSKVIITDAAGTHMNSANDVFAMTAGDITRWGGKPLVFVNVLDVSTLDQLGTKTNKACRQLITGMGAVAKEQGIVCFRGETAELSACVGSENPNATVKFNWAGFMIGAMLPDRIITGETLAHNQIVVALQETGCRSNGMSAVRRGLRQTFGDQWWSVKEAQAWITQAATPSTLYDRFLADANGWVNPVKSPFYKMHLIAHISGGGIVDKFGKDLLFRYGFGAELTNLFEPPEVLKQTRHWTEMSDEEAYQTFSSGNGALVVLDAKDALSFIHAAPGYGIKARQVGRITKSGEPRLRILSGYTGNMLEFTPT